jgi:hypothetical protein
MIDGSDVAQFSVRGQCLSAFEILGKTPFDSLLFRSGILPGKMRFRLKVLGEQESGSRRKGLETPDENDSRLS